MITDYAFAVVDLSYLLQRNVYACARKPFFTVGSVVQMTIQTLNKIPRDYGIKMSKYILLADKWLSDFPGYYRHKLLQGHYKTDRIWMTQEMIDEMKNDPNISEKDIKKAELDLKAQEIRTEAKEILKNELRYFGVPCIWQEGWEFDDCAYLFAGLWYTGQDQRKSVIITKDSDLQYSINPKVDYFRLPQGGSDPEIITYQDMYNSLPRSIKKKNISLYQYKAYHDALGFGHNMMKRTAKYYGSPTEIIEGVIDGDYSMVSDVDLFNLQLSTFDISKFPGLNEITEKLKTDIWTIGSLGDINQFHDFCRVHDINGISDRYYTEFISRFDQKLFTE